ncbi:uncharacterized protein LOC123506274 isoform X2 [Portunus trituberculatus]|uniref:uncharacterized protein LOC123506274 isoform X2 n=1 Tax=Portunus trituberculatus TaxID=210409 RepID=UPI001E1CB5F9|nr:uncharacterized protein LOC123506274 isoform X2 [Portunus trituberculatus]
MAFQYTVPYLEPVRSMGWATERGIFVPHHRHGRLPISSLFALPLRPGAKPLPTAAHILRHSWFGRRAGNHELLSVHGALLQQASGSRQRHRGDRRLPGPHPHAAARLSVAGRLSLPLGLLHHSHFSVDPGTAGAVVLHCPVMMLLLHPISWHRRAPEKSPEDPVGLQAAKEDASETHKPLSQGLPRGSSVPTDLLKLGGGLRREMVIAKRLRSGSECHTDTQWLDQRGSAFRLGGSTFMAGSVLTLQDNDVTEERQQEGDKQMSPARRVWIKFRSQYNLRLMKDPLAMGIALATCLSITGGINIFAAIPFVLAEADYSLQDIATAMSVTAVVDLFTRMLGAFITDCPKVDVRLLYAFAQLIYIVVPYVLMCNSDQQWITLACMAALGIGLGLFYLLDMLLVVRVLGVHRMSTVMGLSQFFRCLAFTALGPSGGQLRDTTGNFFATVLFMSSVVLVGHIFLIFTTFTAHCCRPATPNSSPAQHRPRV